MDGETEGARRRHGAAPAPDDGLAALLNVLRATFADVGGDDDPAPLIDVARRYGSLTRFAGGAALEATQAHDWQAILRWLSSVGGIDLSLARLLEGHVNALHLVALYGSPGQRRSVGERVRAGALMGVWGADDTEPVRIEPTDAGCGVLAGSKRFASGAGHVALAIVPLADGTLLLLDVGEASRADLSGWRMRGMRRSASGRYRFDGMAVGPDERLGEIGDYRREPHFVGGVWRCAAAQLGAVEAIVAGLADALRATARDAHPVQAQRLGAAAMAARTARLWVEDAAGSVAAAADGTLDVVLAVARSAYARLAVEKAGMEIVALAERGLGLGLFAEGHPLEALCRDLSVYLRQADPDQLLASHAGPLLAAMRGRGVG